MTPEELEKLPKPLERLMTSLELDIMSEVIERIKEAQQIIPVTDWLLNRLSIIGASKSRVKQILQTALEAADLQVDDIYNQAAKSDYTRTKAIYEAAGQDYTPYEDNQYLQQIVDAVRRQTKESLRAYENITQTTGFNVYMGGKRVFTPMSEYLERSLDKAMLGITTGMKTYSQAIGDVIDEMTSSGVRIVDYASGKSDRIEVAARRAVMTGVAQLTDKVNEKNAEELQTDYWEVDWHMGARNTGTGYMNHQSWQGKVYSSEEMRTVCGLGEMLGFAGINCYHIRFPFIPGVSKRKYTDEWLVEQNRKENEKKEFRGKEYDTYAALQYQRKLERVIRKQKQDIKLLEKGGADKDDLIAARCRKRLTEKTYTEFSAAMGLRQQRERLKVGELKQNKLLQAPQIKDKAIRKAYDDLTSILANNPSNDKSVLDMIMYSETANYQENPNLKVAFNYDIAKDVIWYNSKAPDFKDYDLTYVQVHELSHRIDYKKYHSWNSDTFQAAIESSSKAVYNYADTVKQWFAEGGKYEADFALSDIISGLSKAGLNDYLIAGHTVEYWADDTNVMLEVFANLNSIEILGYDSIVEIKKIFPELYAAYKEVIGWT